MSADQTIANGDDVPRALDLKTWQKQKTLLNRLAKLIKRNLSIPRPEKLELKAVMVGFRQTLLKTGRAFHAEQRQNQGAVQQHEYKPRRARINSRMQGEKAEQGDKGPGQVENEPASDVKPDPRTVKKERKRARREINRMARRLGSQLRIRGNDEDVMGK